MTLKRTICMCCCTVVIIFVMTIFSMTAACIGHSETMIMQDSMQATPMGAALAQNMKNDGESTSFTPGDNYGSFLLAAPLLGRPTDHSVNINVVPVKDLEISIEYWNSTVASLLRTPSVAAKADVPQNFVISNLEPDTGYKYHLCYRTPSDPAIQYSPEYSFHTQRRIGSTFVFDVQADSHLDERASVDLYQQTLKNVLGDEPDFLIDLGDTFMTDKLPAKNNQTYLYQYLRQRSLINEVGHSVPLFIVLGNHDGEAGYALDGTNENIAVCSLYLRKMYFPNPEPDGFYTGNIGIEDLGGTRQDYYSWEWGDALFVVLDPYWYTTAKPGGRIDPWAWTLGEVQYNWLRDTLEKSRAKYKFVFAHQLVGGDRQGRGGVEYASFYEWGGKNLDGSWGFELHRPGWEVPIHRLLVENNVTIFFHGHDHLFARQELDGVVYQEVPQPATGSSTGASPGTEYGYINGVMRESPGHIRVTISSESVQIDYIWSGLSGDNKSASKNGDVAYSYTL
jgi:hypothetical protein